MNPLSEFQRVNGGEDDLLPLYITKETNNNIISKRASIFIAIVLICFVITSISIYEFILYFF
jgi:hypothetical protein